MGHWQRAKMKSKIQDDFLSALQADDAGSSTKTTSARSSMLIAAATLASYRATRLSARILKSAKKRSAKASRKKR